MKLEDIITQSTIGAIKELYGQDVKPETIQLQKTKKEFEGSLTLVVFPLLRISHKKPEETADDLGKYLMAHCPAVEKYGVVKGFLNLSISTTAWTDLLKSIDDDPDYGHRKATEESPLVMVEYSSPNTNKPLHLGHVRNNLLGWSLAKIMEANGYKVVKTNIVNDRGIHICKSMLAWLRWGDGQTPETSGKKGDHLVGDFYVEFNTQYTRQYLALAEELKAQGVGEEEAINKAKEEAPLLKEAHDMLVKWEQGDPEVRELWARMNGWVYKGFAQTYDALGVSFDKIYYESETYLRGKAKVEEGLAKGLFERHDDGSVWADLTADGLDQKLLLRSDGTSVYMTQDIGTAEMRFNDYPIDKMIYVVGNEQNYHFQVLSLLLDRLGFKWGKELVHFSYGMVELPTGKLKSREGKVVDADDLVEKMISDAKEAAAAREGGQTEEVSRIVGLGALKYFILKVDARKNMLFNPEESIDLNGNTGPFIQYTYARIRSIMRKAEESTGVLTPDPRSDSSVGATHCGRPEPALSGEVSAFQLSAKETSLVQKLSDYPDVVTQAGKDYSPSGIANYCYELTKEFNQFYHDFTILKEPNPQLRAFRLMLADNVAKTIKRAMDLLGIEVPERM